MIRKTPSALAITVVATLAWSEAHAQEPGKQEQQPGQQQQQPQHGKQQQQPQHGQQQQRPGQQGASKPQSGQQQAQMIGTVDQVASNPEPYLGKQIMLSGEIDDVIDRNAFTLEDDDFIFDEEILVLTKNPLSGEPNQIEERYEDQDMVVRGVLRRFNAAEVERELGMRLDRDVYDEFDGKLVLISEGFEPVRVTVVEPISDLIVILDPINRGDLAGKQVNLKDVKVQEVEGKSGFWVGLGQGQQIFVRSQKDAQGQANQIKTGDTIDLQATVRQTPSEDSMKKRWGLDADAADEIQDQGLFLSAESIGRG